MRVSIKLDDDQVEDVIREGLKKAYLIHLDMTEDNEFHITEAFRIMLDYFMTEKDYKKFMKETSKEVRQYNYSKRLVEANNGL